jgi:hypothetical protein
LTAFAQKVYRHPPSVDEQTSLGTLYADLRGKGLTVEESVRWGAMGILMSPQSLYRTEIGQPLGDGTAPLTAYELASQLSYFISDGPPDAALLTAAADGSLSTTDGLRAQVDRLLALPTVQENLSKVMLSSSGLVKIFPDV